MKEKIGCFFVILAVVILGCLPKKSDIDELVPRNYELPAEFYEEDFEDIPECEDTGIEN